MSDPVDAFESPRTLASLAAQLRDGPLQQLTELHRKTTLLSRDAAATERERLEQLTELALVSLEAMEHFHAFTRELRAQIAELVAMPGRDPH
jgi:hypothetical protein